MTRVITPNVQPMRYALRFHNGRQLHIRIQAHIPLARCQHNFHPPISAQEPLVGHVRQKIWRAVEVTVIVVISIEELMNIKRRAHADAMRDQVGMFEREIHGMVSAKTAPRHR